MDKLTIEEKAKAYDEAIKYARYLINECCKEGTNGSFHRADLDKMFSELIESKDERIRKSIISGMKALQKKGKYTRFANIPVNNVIAWLEKQGEKKPTLEDAAKAFLEALSETPYNNTPIVEAQIITKQLLIFLSAPKSYNPDAINEQKPAENKGMNLVEEEMTPFQKKVFCIIDTTIEEEQGLKQVCDELLTLASNEIKQKPAEWSEEDEKMLNSIIWHLRNSVNNGDRYYSAGQLEDWLKSLKEHIKNK